MLRTIRIVLAVLCIVAISLLFVDVSGFAATHWSWLAKIQFMPALLSLNAVMIICLLLLTLLLGRVYCSVICPLGIFQDVVIKLRSWFGGKKSRNRFRFHGQYKHARYTVFTLFIVLLILGITNLTATAIAGLVEPYSAYGRISTQLFSPVYDGANNILADWSAANGNYLFSHVAHVTRVPLFIVAALTFIVVVAFAWVGGRNYCNMVCPVGTALGLLSRFSVFKPVIDKSRCNGCRKCERNCKSSCIDGHNHKIDYSRCVVCMDCIGNCAQHAISYRFAPLQKTLPSKVDAEVKSVGRRRFIITGAVVSATLAAQAHEGGDGALAPIKMKKRSSRKVPVVPPGAKSIANLSSHCTACQLCVNSCPNDVLHPSTDLATFMQPQMWFNQGYCRPECTSCSSVCPAGAILPVTKEEKTAIKIGTAVVEADKCISASAGQHCGLCSRACPARAIEMVHGDNGNLRPVVNEEACIGCGSCEYHCPVGTAGHIRSDRAAIHVEGIEMHRNTI